MGASLSFFSPIGWGFLVNSFAVIANHNTNRQVDQDNARPSREHQAKLAPGFDKERRQAKSPEHRPHQVNVPVAFTHQRDKETGHG